MAEYAWGIAGVPGKRLSMDHRGCTIIGHQVSLPPWERHTSVEVSLHGTAWRLTLTAKSSFAIDWPLCFWWCGQCLPDSWEDAEHLASLCLPSHTFSGPLLYYWAKSRSWGYVIQAGSSHSACGSWSQMELTRVAWVKWHTWHLQGLAGDVACRLGPWQWLLVISLLLACYQGSLQILTFTPNRMMGPSKVLITNRDTSSVMF